MFSIEDACLVALEDGLRRLCAACAARSTHLYNLGDLIKVAGVSLLTELAGMDILQGEKTLTKT
jgi:hypothetical protein